MKGLKIEISRVSPKSLDILWEDTLFRTVSKGLFSRELKGLQPHLTYPEFLAAFALIESKVGRRYAIYLLSQRALLGAELQEKLVAKGLSLAIAEQVVAYCKKMGYINDAGETKRRVAKELKKGRSMRATRYKLMQKKGVDETALQEALQNAGPTEEEALQKQLAKYAKKIDLKDREERRKLLAKLCRQGFSIDSVFKAFDDF